MRNKIVGLLFAVFSLFSIAFLSASSAQACGPGETECNNGCGYYCKPPGQACPCSAPAQSSGGGGGGSAPAAPAPAPAQVFGSCDGQPIGSEHRNAGNGCFYTCTSGGWSGPNKCDGKGNGQYQGEAATTVAEREAQAEQVVLRNQEAQQVVAAQGIAETAKIAGQTAEQRMAEADKQRSMVQAQTAEAIKAIQASDLPDAEKAKQIAAITAASNQALILVGQAAGVTTTTARSGGSRASGVITGKTGLGIECSSGSECISGNCQLPSSLGENETAGASVCSLNIDNYDGEVTGKFYCEKLGRYVDSPTTALVAGGQSACNAAYAVEYSKGRVTATKKNDWDSCTLSSECKNSFCNNGICGSVDCSANGSCTVKSIVCTGNKCDVNLNKEVTVQDLRVQADKEKQIISVIDSSQTSLVDETLGTVISAVNKAQAESKCPPLWQTSVQKCEFATSTKCQIVDGCPQPISEVTALKDLAKNNDPCTSLLDCGQGLDCVDVKGIKTCQIGSLKDQPKVNTFCPLSTEIDRCWCSDAGKGGRLYSIERGASCTRAPSEPNDVCVPGASATSSDGCNSSFACIKTENGSYACRQPILFPVNPGKRCEASQGCSCAFSKTGFINNTELCPERDPATLACPNNFYRTDADCSRAIKVDLEQQCIPVVSSPNGCNFEAIVRRPIVKFKNGLGCSTFDQCESGFCQKLPAGAICASPKELACSIDGVYTSNKDNCCSKDAFRDTEGNLKCGFNQDYANTAATNPLFRLQVTSGRGSTVYGCTRCPTNDLTGCVPENECLTLKDARQTREATACPVGSSATYDTCDAVNEQPCFPTKEGCFAPADARSVSNQTICLPQGTQIGLNTSSQCCEAAYTDSQAVTRCGPKPGQNTAASCRGSGLALSDEENAEVCCDKELYVVTSSGDRFCGKNPETVTIVDRVGSAASDAITTAQKVVTSTLNSIGTFFSNLFSGKPVGYGVSCLSNQGYPAAARNECAAGAGKDCDLNSTDGCYYMPKEDLINLGSGEDLTCPGDATMESCKRAYPNNDCFERPKGCFVPLGAVGAGTQATPTPPVVIAPTPTPQVFDCTKQFGNTYYNDEQRCSSALKSQSINPAYNYECVQVANCWKIDVTFK